MTRFEDECLDAHNKYRRVQGVPPLKYNRKIAAIAQKWADDLARTGRFQHSQDRKLDGQQMGENIAMKWSSDNQDYPGDQPTKQWYDEISKYSFTSHSGPGTGHFTQVVWKDSRELGVGRAQAPGGKWLVVANYLPAGNVVGRYAENVLPPGSKPSPASSAAGSSGSSPTVAHARVTQQPQVVRAYSDGSPVSDGGSSTTTKTVTKETRTEGGPSGGYRKCIVTETTIGPDGSKRVVTRETVMKDGDDDFSRRFDEIREKYGFSNSPRTRTNHSYNNNVHVQNMGVHKSDSSFSNDFEKQRKEFEKERREMEKKLEKERTEREKQEEKDRKEMEKKIEKEIKEREKEAAKKADEKKPQKMKDFIDDVIKAHNKYRKNHGKVGGLKQSKDLSVLAQRWADHLAASSVLKHSNDTYRGEQLGENVATKWSSVGTDYTGQEVTDQWYNEVEKFDFRNNSFKSGTGHFTQVVWKGSNKIGVGKAFGRDGRVFVVCNYLPAGNVIGQFQDNVFPA